MKAMKRFPAVTALTILLVIPPALAADQAAEKAARVAAESWLALIDSGQYAESWDEASPFFQSKVGKQEWIGMVQSARSSFGKLNKRVFGAAKYMTELPGAPDGKYVVIQFQALFEQKKKAVETITPKLAPDGKWRVSGYFIK